MFMSLIILSFVFVNSISCFLCASHTYLLSSFVLNLVFATLILSVIENSFKCNKQVCWNVVKTVRNLTPIWRPSFEKHRLIKNGGEGIIIDSVLRRFIFSPMMNLGRKFNLPGISISPQIKICVLGLVRAVFYLLGGLGTRVMGPRMIQNPIL